MAISTKINEFLTADNEDLAEFVAERMAELMPEFMRESEGWAVERIQEYMQIFADYLREGDYDAVHGRIIEVSREVVRSKMTLEHLVRLITDISMRRKRKLMDALADDPKEILKAFVLFDEFEGKLLDEFARAQARYWRKRESAAVKLHADFFTNSPFPALTGDADMTIEEINPAALKFLGIRDDQAVGMDFFAWLRTMQLSIKRVKQLRNEMGEHGRFLNAEVDIACPNDCESKEILLTANYTTNPEGQVAGFQAVLQDVTEQKELERDLERKIRQLDAIFASSPVGIVYVHSSRVIRRVNREATRLMNYPPPEEIVNRRMRDFVETSKGSHKDPKRYLEVLNEVYSDPEASSLGVWEIVGPPKRLVRYSVTPVHTDDGKAIGWLWILNDVTERITRDRLRRDLTHMLVHDLKNPLTAIQGGIHVVRNLVEGKADAADQALEIITRNSDRLLRMVMNLLDVERLEHGRLELDRKEFCVSELLESVLKDQAPAAGKRILRLSLDERLPQRPAIADVELLERIVTNLVSNAIKHTRPRGHVTVHAEPSPEDGLRISVVDDGEGIPKEYHEKIFERFGQVEMREQKHKVDSGLGLTFCKLAVEAHEGTIEVESKAGEGAKFIVNLPGAFASANASVSESAA